MAKEDKIISQYELQLQESIVIDAKHELLVKHFKIDDKEMLLKAVLQNVFRKGYLEGLKWLHKTLENKK